MTLFRLRALTVFPGADDETLQLQLAYPRGGDSLKLRATSSKDCTEWIKSIDRASTRCRQVARELR